MHEIQLDYKGFGQHLIIGLNYYKHFIIHDTCDLSKEFRITALGNLFVYKLGFNSEEHVLW